MKVLIDTLPLYGKGAGLRTYTAGLLRALHASNADMQWHVALRDDDAERLGLAEDTRFHTSRLAPPVRVSALPGARFAWRNAAEHLLVPALSARYDVVHLLDSYGPMLPMGAPLLLTVHDLLPLTSTDYFTPLVRAYLAGMMRLGIPRAQAIMADSAATAHQLHAVLGVATERITVVPMGVDERFRPATAEERTRVATRYSLTAPYVIYVGGINPRKNVARLVRAFAQTHHERALPHRLLIVGKLGWQYDDVLDAIREAQLGEAIQLLGHVDDADIAPLIAGADALAYLSLEEGFGLPVIEAMACGTPVLTSATSSTGEVGQDTAVLVDPTDEQAIGAALTRLCTDSELRASLRSRGIEAARRYTWAGVASAAINLYHVLARTGGWGIPALVTAEASHLPHTG